MEADNRMKSRNVVLVATLALCVNIAAMADGGATFKAKCAMCHGADGSGNTGIGKSMGLRDLGSAEVQSMSETDLAALISNGKGKMPAYKDKLSAGDISDLVKYIRTLKK